MGSRYRSMVSGPIEPIKPEGTLSVLRADLRHPMISSAEFFARTMIVRALNDGRQRRDSADTY